MQQAELKAVRERSVRLALPSKDTEIIKELKNKHADAVAGNQK